MRQVLQNSLTVRLAVLGFVMAILDACVTSPESYYIRTYDGPPEREIVRVADEEAYYNDVKRRLIMTRDIGRFFRSRDAAVRDFFIDEAVKAGVTRFGPMLELDRRPPGRQKLCGASRTNTFVILIDIDRTHCMSLLTYAHEITHVAVYDRNCFGRGDIFYAYLTEIAQRFEARFPGYRWTGKRPTEAVHDQSLRYRRNEDRCRGIVRR